MKLQKGIYNQAIKKGAASKKTRVNKDVKSKVVVMVGKNFNDDNSSEFGAKSLVEAT